MRPGFQLQTGRREPFDFIGHHTRRAARDPLDVEPADPGVLDRPVGAEVGAADRPAVGEALGARVDRVRGHAGGVAQLRRENKSHQG